MIFEITQKPFVNNPSKRLRVLFINDTYRAYEQDDGKVLLNDEKAGYSFYPDETYEEFSKRLLTQQHFMHEK